MAGESLVTREQSRGLNVGASKMTCKVFATGIGLFRYDRYIVTRLLGQLRSALCKKWNQLFI